MSVLKSIRNLFIEPEVFFENYTKNRLGIPFLITVVYAAVAAVCAYISSMQTAAQAFADIPGVSMEDVMPALAGTAAASAFFLALLAWLGMSLLFVIALKIFCRPAPKVKEIMHITAYGAIPLCIATVVEMLISFTGSAPSWATLILSAAVLFLTIPIWVKGFEKFGAGPEKRVLTAVLAACIVPALITLFPIITALVL
ncbi:MAG TPA: YIP1 family protein [Methanocorpusculum sp.]|nr:YIP1 family protein [Methanocorpusculum sp.]